MTAAELDALVARLSVAKLERHEMDVLRKHVVAAITELRARVEELDPDPVVCDCREAICPHTPIAKLPRQDLVDLFRKRIKDAEARVAELEALPAEGRLELVFRTATDRADALASKWAETQEAYDAICVQLEAEREADIKKGIAQYAERQELLAELKKVRDERGALRERLQAKPTPRSIRESEL